MVIYDQPDTAYYISHLPDIFTKLMSTIKYAMISMRSIGKKSDAD